MTLIAGINMLQILPIITRPTGQFIFMFFTTIYQKHVQMHIVFVTQMSLW